MKMCFLVFFLMVVEPSKVYYLHIVELSYYPIPVQILLTFSSLCMFSVAISKKIKKIFTQMIDNISAVLLLKALQIDLTLTWPIFIDTFLL